MRYHANLLSGLRTLSGLKLFIQQNAQKNTKEIESYIENNFILWFDKYILNILIIFILLMNKTC